MVGSRSELKIKSKNYFCLKWETQTIDKDYLICFLNSKIGKLILSAEKSTNYIPTLSLTKLRNIEIKLPELSIQKELSASVLKVNKIYQKIEKMKSDIELNPLSAKNIEKLDNILYSMEEFTLENKTKRLIAIGENKTIEFKSTLSYDLRSKQKNKDLEHSCLKTIVAFLNCKRRCFINWSI